MPAPWDQWRHDINEKMDRWGEDKLHLGKNKSGSYEERLARMRAGGGAYGTVVGEGQPRLRAVPPPPPGASTSVPSYSAPLSPMSPPSADVPHIQFSRFTEADKHAFFALLDEVS